MRKSLITMAGEVEEKFNYPWLTCRNYKEEVTAAIRLMDEKGYSLDEARKQVMEWGGFTDGDRSFYRTLWKQSKLFEEQK